jgi:hypothetical protein
LEAADCYENVRTYPAASIRSLTITLDVIIAGTTFNRIATGSAVDLVIARTALDCVVARPAFNAVIAWTAIDIIIARGCRLGLGRRDGKGERWR